jgi:hypothetical protein
VNPECSAVALRAGGRLRAGAAGPPPVQCAAPREPAP